MRWQTFGVALCTLVLGCSDSKLGGAVATDTGADAAVGGQDVPSDSASAPDVSAPVDASKDTGGPVVKPVACIKDKPCDDLDPCTQDDTCKDGVCQGTAYSCDDGVECTHDVCDGAGGCSNPLRGDACLISGTCYADGEPDPAMPCRACIAPVDQAAFSPDDTRACDDGDVCTEGDACKAGLCKGTPKTCDDGNLCTKDACDPKTGCQSAPFAAPCSDGDPCTVGDLCKEGQCAPGDGTLSCGDGNPCTDDACEPGKGCVNGPNAAPCDDGDICTVSDKCQSGACASGEALSCGDGNPCTDDGCDALLGCVTAPNTAACDDGNLCTVGDQCNAGKCIPGPDPLECDDDNPCTDDDCDGTLGCIATPNPDPCDDGNACTVGDACAGGSCLAGPDTPDCNDGNACTDDSCAPEVGCVTTPNVNSCDDASVCTTGDMCAAGSCKGSPISCDDGNACTADACDPKTGCSHTPIVSFECAPNIQITTPARGATLNGAPSVKVAGKVTSGGGAITSFKITGQTVAVAPDGTFSMQMTPHHGLNVIKAEAVDAIGGAATAVQSYYFSFEWTPIKASDPPASYVEDGLAIWLGQEVIDDGVHDVNNVDDLATVFEIIAASFDLGGLIANPVTHQAGFDINVKGLTHNKPKVSLLSINGGLHMMMVLDNVKIDIQAKCTEWFCFGASPTGKVTMSSIVIDMDLMLGLNVATGKVKATAANTKVKINNLDISLDGVLGFLTNWLINFFEGSFTTSLQNTFKDQLATQLPPIVSSALESLAFDSDFSIPPIMGGGDSITVQLRTALSSLDFKTPGGTLGMFATAVTPKKVGHTVLGSIGRAACLSGGTETFGFANVAPLQIALHDDFFNQILFGIYWGGGLAFPVGPDMLGSVDLTKYGITDLTLDIDFMLAPIVTSCNPTEKLKIQVGDMHIHAVMTLGGVKLDMDVYVSFEANAGFQIIDKPTGAELGVAIEDITMIEADVLFADPKLIGFKDAVLGLIQEQLVPTFLDSLAGSALGGFPLPAIDLSGASAQIPPGTELELDLKTVARDKGYTLLQGDVK